MATPLHHPRARCALIAPAFSDVRLRITMGLDRRPVAAAAGRLLELRVGFNYFIANNLRSGNT